MTRPFRSGLMALAFTTMCAFTGQALAEEKAPIRIGFIMAKQGPLAEHGKQQSEGAQLALEQFNKTVRGAPVELIWLDEPTPQDAQQNMQRLIDEQKVVAVLGGSNSATALAMSAVANQTKTPFIATNAAATAITGAKCNRYTFRTHLPVPPQVRAITGELEKHGKDWYFMAASYAFGQDIVKSFQAELEKIGGKTVAVDEAPLSAPDYTSYILKIRAAKPDVVVGGLAGSDISTFLKQWNEMGMRQRIPFAQIGVADADIWGIGPKAVAGIYSKIWYYDNPDNSPEDKEFAKSYQERFGRPAPDRSWMGWYATRMLLQSLEAADSLKSADVVRALEAWKDDDRGTSFRTWDHQMLNPVVIAQAKSEVTGEYAFLDVLATVPATDALYGTKEQVGCEMGEL